MNEPPTLLALKAHESGHWLGIRLRGTQSNRSALGARVEIQAGDVKQSDEVRSGGSYLSQSDLRLHFGLGRNRKVDQLTINWPSGAINHFKNIPADQQIVIEEGASNWRPAGVKNKD